MLISQPDDAEDIARNMIRLVENKELGEKLRKNAALTEYEEANNTEIIAHWVAIYEAICRYNYEGVPIPNEFLS